MPDAPQDIVVVICEHCSLVHQFERATLQKLITDTGALIGTCPFCQNALEVSQRHLDDDRRYEPLTTAPSIVNFCDYIERHAHEIYVRFDGDNHQLSSLSASDALHHAFTWIKERRAPYRVPYDTAHT